MKDITFKIETNKEKKKKETEKLEEMFPTIHKEITCSCGNTTFTVIYHINTKPRIYGFISTLTLTCTSCKKPQKDFYLED